MTHNHLYAGLDIGSTNFVSCFLNSNGERLLKKTQHFPNDFNGASLLVKSTLDLISQYSMDSVSFGMESTSNYHWHLVNFLSTHLDLAPFHPSVYAINPRLIHAFKKVYPDLQHNDDVDAFVIAERLRFGRLPPSSQVNFLFEPIKRLTRFRYHLSSSMAREKNYFLNILFYKFSTFSNSDAFSNLFGTSSLSLISDFESIEDILAKPLDELASFLMQKSENHFKNPLDMAKTIHQAACNSYRLDKTLANPINTILSSILLNINTFKDQIKKIDDVIARELAAFPNQKKILSSIPGIGPIISAGILAETGDINKFHSEAAYAKYAGLVWKHAQSGNFEAEESFLTQNGNPYLKYYIIEAANLIRRHDPIFKAFYQRKFDEAVKHHHKRAVVLTARKLLRVIYYLLKDNKLYSPQFPS